MAYLAMGGGHGGIIHRRGEAVSANKGYDD
jgi:hypothetical protein